VPIDWSCSYATPCLVSLFTPEGTVDLYTPITTEMGIPVQIET